MAPPRQEDLREKPSRRDDSGAQLHQGFDEHFLLVDSFKPEDSDLGRVGAERWYVWRKRPGPSRP